MVGIIGYTGTVGQHLAEQYKEFDGYNTKNINTIDGKEFDLLIVSGISATKWLANKDDEADKAGINKLFERLEKVKSKRTVLISTIDVHSNDNYGRNRMLAESRAFGMHNLGDVRVLRLPGLVGKHIKKNFIYDLAHPEKDLSFTSVNSVFEFIDLEDIKKYIDNLLESELKVMELRSTPIEVEYICKKLDINMSKLNTNEGAVYSHKPQEYIIECLNKEEEIELIKNYVKVYSITN